MVEVAAPAPSRVGILGSGGEMPVPETPLVKASTLDSPTAPAVCSCTATMAQ